MGVLGPAHGNRPIQSVSAELLLDALQEVRKLPAFDAVRRIADDPNRIGGDGLTVNGLLTRHALEYRLKGDPARWESAAEEVGAVKPTDSWLHVVRKLGYALQQLPQRGYLARYEGKPVELIHPKRTARDLARVDSQGPPAGRPPSLGLRSARGTLRDSRPRKSLPAVRCPIGLSRERVARSGHPAPAGAPLEAGAAPVARTAPPGCSSPGSPLPELP